MHQCKHIMQAYTKTKLLAALAGVLAMPFQYRSGFLPIVCKTLSWDILNITSWSIAKSLLLNQYVGFNLELFKWIFMYTWKVEKWQFDLQRSRFIVFPCKFNELDWMLSLSFKLNIYLKIFLRLTVWIISWISVIQQVCIKYKKVCSVEVKCSEYAAAMFYHLYGCEVGENGNSQLNLELYLVNKF